MSLNVIRAGVEQVAVAAPLFDAYRQFYGQKPDLPGATAFLRERLTRGESVVFLALDGEAALGFVQLYPSFSSVRMRPIWVLYDLFVTEAARRGGVARLLMDAALPCFENAAALAPQDYRWPYYAGLAARTRGDLDRARAFFRHALELMGHQQPGVPEEHPQRPANLGQFRHEFREDVPDASHHVVDVVELLPAVHHAGQHLVDVRVLDQPLAADLEPAQGPGRIAVVAGRRERVAAAGAPGQLAGLVEDRDVDDLAAEPARVEVERDRLVVAAPVGFCEPAPGTRDVENKAQPRLNVPDVVDLAKFRIRSADPIQSQAGIERQPPTLQESWA